MFGYWKREAAAWKDAYLSIEARIGEVRRERNDANDSLRRADSDLAAADLQLAAERQDNEALRARLKTVQAGLDHATRCYEQCELDRQALARERDDAVKILRNLTAIFNNARALMKAFGVHGGPADAQFESVVPWRVQTTADAGTEATEPANAAQPADESEAAPEAASSDDRPIGGFASIVPGEACVGFQLKPRCILHPAAYNPDTDPDAA